MRQFVFADLTRDEFAGFAAHARHGNFQQTVMMADLRVAQGQTIDYVGVREHGAVVAAALVATHGSGLTAFSTISRTVCAMRRASRCQGRPASPTRR